MDVKATSSPGASSRSKDIVVFWIVRDSVCAECGEVLGKGRFLRMEAERPLCLSCADLAHLVFLERGNTALTRRATRHSTLHAVVVRFSRARKRYERQGVLVEEAALAKAEAECLSDGDAREVARERAAARRVQLDAVYVEAFARRVAELFPGCPRPAQQAIAEHACERVIRSDWPIGRGQGTRCACCGTCCARPYPPRAYAVRSASGARCGSV